MCGVGTCTTPWVGVIGVQTVLGTGGEGGTINAECVCQLITLGACAALGFQERVVCIACLHWGNIFSVRESGLANWPEPILSTRAPGVTRKKVSVFTGSEFGWIRHAQPSAHKGRFCPSGVGVVGGGRVERGTALRIAKDSQKP